MRNWLLFETKAPVVAVESAILSTSGLAETVTEIWLVTAPEHMRVERVMKRNNLAREQILKRMEAQRQEYSSLPAEKLHLIYNDGVTPLLPQINRLLLN